jgi:hypothetical protein
VGKCGQHVRLTTLPPSCAVVKKSGNLNFLEPSGSLQACNGTALPSYSQLHTFPAYISLPVMVFRGCDFGFSLAATLINFLLCITQCFLQLVIFLYFVLWAGGLNPEWLGHEPELSNRWWRFALLPIYFYVVFKQNMQFWKLDIFQKLIPSAVCILYLACYIRCETVLPHSNGPV